MAAQTINVSGVAALRYILTANTQFFFTGAVDGQKLRLTLQMDSTGGWTVSSGNCPGIMQPNGTASLDTTQELIYDAATNTWNGVPQQLAPGSVAFTTFTTNSTITWQKGTVILSGAAAITLTITNPTSGPPGTGNDGEVMTFVVGTAHAHKITMATTTSINASSTSATFVGHIGEAMVLEAQTGNVWVTAQSTISTNGGVTLS